MNSGSGFQTSLDPGVRFHDVSGVPVAGPGDVVSYP
jgi:hypothetical protein